MATPVPEVEPWLDEFRRLGKEFARDYPIEEEAIHDVRELGRAYVTYAYQRRPSLFFVFDPEMVSLPHVVALLWPRVEKGAYEIFEASRYVRVPATDEIRELLPGAKNVVMREADWGDNVAYRELYASVMAIVYDRATRAAQNSESGRKKKLRRLVDARALLPARKAV